MNGLRVLALLYAVCVVEYQKLFQSPVTRHSSGVSTNQQPALGGFILLRNCAVVLLHMHAVFGRLQTFCLLACTCLSVVNVSR